MTTGMTQDPGAVAPAIPQSTVLILVTITQGADDPLSTAGTAVQPTATPDLPCPACNTTASNSGLPFHHDDGPYRRAAIRRVGGGEASTAAGASDFWKQAYEEQHRLVASNRLMGGFLGLLGGFIVGVCFSCVLLLKGGLVRRSSYPSCGIEEGKYKTV